MLLVLESKCFLFGVLSFVDLVQTQKQENDVTCKHFCFSLLAAYIAGQEREGEKRHCCYPVPKISVYTIVRTRRKKASRYISSTPLCVDIESRPTTDEKERRKRIGDISAHLSGWMYIRIRLEIEMDARSKSSFASPNDGWLSVIDERAGALFFYLLSRTRESVV